MRFHAEETQFVAGYSVRRRLMADYMPMIYQMPARRGLTVIALMCVAGDQPGWPRTEVFKPDAFAERELGNEKAPHIAGLELVDSGRLLERCSTLPRQIAFDRLRQTDLAALFAARLNALCLLY